MLGIQFCMFSWLFLICIGLFGNQHTFANNIFDMAKYTSVSNPTLEDELVLKSHKDFHGCLRNFNVKINDVCSSTEIHRVITQFHEIQDKSGGDEAALTLKLYMELARLECGFEMEGPLCSLTGKCECKANAPTSCSLHKPDPTVINCEIEYLAQLLAYYIGGFTNTTVIDKCPCGTLERYASPSPIAGNLFNKATQDLRICLQNFNIEHDKPCDKTKYSEEEKRLNTLIKDTGFNYAAATIEQLKTLQMMNCPMDSSCNGSPEQCHCLDPKNCPVFAQNKSASCDVEYLAYRLAAYKAGHANTTVIPGCGCKVTPPIGTTTGVAITNTTLVSVTTAISTRKTGSTDTNNRFPAFRGSMIRVCDGTSIYNIGHNDYFHKIKIFMTVIIVSIITS